MLLSVSYNMTSSVRHSTLPCIFDETGKAINSPCEIIANPTGIIYFPD